MSNINNDKSDFFDIVFGAYEPQLKAITVNNENIKRFATKNPETLQSIVYIHEYFHWLQLNSSSLGHLLSSIPNIHDRILTFAMESPKLFNEKYIFKKPALENVEGYTEIEINVMKNDLKTIEYFEEFIMKTNTVENVKNKYHEYNQACFSFFDMYLMDSSEIIIKKYGETAYKNIVESNRNFWDSKRNYIIMNLHESLPIIGFKDLIECAARIVELKNYNNFVELYSKIGMDVSLEDVSYFWNKEYFIPVNYIIVLFDENINEDYVLDFLLLSIHISINPSVAPFYTLMYQKNNTISDIHPGMRFSKILNYIKKEYGTIKIAMSDMNLKEKLLKNLNWSNEEEQFNDYKIFYRDNYQIMNEKLKEENVSKKIYKNDFYHYKHYTMLELKSVYSDFFIDINSYLNDMEKLKSILEIDEKIYCPIIFNEYIGKYQMNVSVFNFEAYSEDSITPNTLKIERDLSDKKKIEYLNYVLNNIYYELDSQLLKVKGELDYSIFEYFDISNSMVDELVEFYNEERGIKDIEYI